MQGRAVGRVVSGVDSVWKGLKDSLLETADDVCGRTKGPRRRKETWWWNDEIGEAVKEKGRLYRIWHKSGSKKDQLTYHIASKQAKRLVYAAKERARKKFGEDLDKADAKGKVFRVANQMKKENRDVVGDGCIRDSNGTVVVEQEKIKEVWKQYFEKLLNEEFDWSRNNLTALDGVPGVQELITVEDVKEAIAKMKANKAAGPSGIVVEMLVAAGDEGVLWVTDLCNAILNEGRIPSDWSKSWLVRVYKGKGDALDCGSYRGIKLLDQGMKIFERVVETKLRRRVKIDDMQFGFRPGRGTTDAIFVVRQVQEKFLAKQKVLWMAFVDLEKAFDRVPREVLWWALRQLGWRSGL